MIKEELFEKQKQMLLTFSTTGAISKEYCEQESRILAEKMGVADCENKVRGDEYAVK